MRLMRPVTFALFLVLTLVLLAAFQSASAQDLELPGLAADADAYAAALHNAVPAGMNAAARTMVEQRAAQTIAAGDWVHAVPLLEQRLGTGDTTPALWLALAQGLERLPTPDHTHALAAAWQAYHDTNPGPDQLPALRVMQVALAALGRKLSEIDVLREETRRAPDDAALQRELVSRMQTYGLLVRSVHTQPESFPARVCIGFTGRVGDGPDFHPGDWVRLRPAVRDIAVTLESDDICIAGLPAGGTTQVTLLQGMPGANGLSLKQPTTLAVAMADRMPRLVFDARRFLQPASMQAQVSLASVNLSKVRLDLARISERGLQAFFTNHPVGSHLDSYDTDSLLHQDGQVVWKGSAVVPDFARNKLVHTTVPLPAAIGKPGLYVLVARAGDGTPTGEISPVAMQMVLRTNLAPTTWRGDDGVTVQVRGYANAALKPDVAVTLISANNSVLATANTDADGIARFAAPLLAGTGGMAPAALHLRGPDGDFTLLDLSEPAFDLSDRGVSGRLQPGPLDAFIWLDRGIYRPGDIVHMMALLRDGGGGPVDVPVHVVVTRPSGQVFADIVPKRSDDAALDVPITLSGGAQAGEWKIALRTAPDAPEIDYASFRVEAFVPARLAVDFGAVPLPLAPGRTSDLPIKVRFLYGAPGADLSGEGQWRLAADPTPFRAFSGYKFGIADETIPPDSHSVDLTTTDASGATTMPVDLSALPDVTEPLAAQLAATINDPAGRPVSATETLPIRPLGPMIGLRSAFTGGAVNPGAPAEFDVIAVDPAGQRIAMPVRATLVRQLPDWRLFARNGIASYETVWQDEPVDSRVVQIPADHPLRLGWQLGYGRYKLVLAQTGQGLAAASTVFESGWTFSGNPDVPARVRVSADRASYRPGMVAHVHIAPPFGGSATLLVLSNRVHVIRAVEAPAAGADLDVPVAGDWGAGAYVVVHVFRPILGAPGAAAQPSDRAIGVTWLQIDPSSRTLPIAFDTPPVLRPRTEATVAIRTTPGAWLTLAAIDEGVLQLTNFQSPDPRAHFFGRRTLGVDIHDEWAHVLRPAEGALTQLHEGGGGEMANATPPPVPQRVVALFTPPVQAASDGVVRVKLALPDFAGQLRLMVVAWAGDKIGAGNTDVTVRDPLVAEALLPRFLAPGDNARLAVLLDNVELPAGAISAHLTTSGPISLTGPADLPATLAPGARALVLSGLQADAPGSGRISLDVTGPDGFTARHETDIFVHPARGSIVVAQGRELAPGATATVAPETSGFLPGTWKATLSIGSAVRYNAAGLVQALSDYPLDCLEQAVSRGLPLAMLPTGPTAGEDRAGRLQQAVGSVLDRQRYDGAFGLWSSEDEAQPWLTAYATEFLLRARDGGAAVPPTAIDAALHWLAGKASESDTGSLEGAAQVYAAYVLALAGEAPAGAIRVIQTRAAQLPTPIARAQLAASLVRIAEPSAARALFREVLANPGRGFWWRDYGTALRDQAATAVLVQESGLNIVPPTRLAALLPGADLDPTALNTQEQAWLAAAGAALRTGTSPLSISIGGSAIQSAAYVSRSVRGAVTLHNSGSDPAWWMVSLSGIPKVPPPASRHLMHVRRLFYSLDGSTIDPGKLTQNSVFIMVIDGGADDNEVHQAIAMAGLPAGWEIAGRFSGGTVDGMHWLGELTAAQAQLAADDRFVAAIGLDPDHENFRIAVMLRAVTPGNYEYPGVALADMYRPAIYARQRTIRVDVSPP
jgi:alpha-2-macroglobulin